MAPFATLLLDLDGTLIDAFTTIQRAYAHTLPQFGRPAPTLAEVRRAVGGGLADAMGRFLPPELVPAALPIHVAYTHRILLEDVVLMPGGRELLQAQHARGVQLAVFTNKQAEASRRICAHLGVTPLLQGIFGAGDTPWLKPQPEFTAHALAALGATAARTLLVGDSPFDVAAARAAGLPCWAVTTGTHDAAQLQAAGATRIFPGLVELGAALA
ncbi:MAG: HAD family hydrolase [Verrucomicrobiota bacterium]